MANTHPETPTLTAESACVSDEATALRDAEGMVWDEFDRICRGLGLSALADSFVGSDSRRLQIEARWEGVPAQSTEER